MLGSLTQDVRLAFRLMRRFPLFAATVIVTVAVGIGANTAIFSAVDAVLLRPLPWTAGDRLVSLWGTNPDKSVPRFGVSYPDFSDWKARTRSFDDMALYAGGLTTMVTNSGPESIAGFSVTPNFLDVFGLQPVLGRGFGLDDQRGESSNTVLLSYGFWQRRFAGDPHVLGQRITVNGRTRTIIGVLPPSAQLLGAAYLGVPLDIMTVVEFSTYPRVERHAQHLFGAFARMKPGVTLAQARADLLGTEQQVAKENAEIAGWTASVFPITDDMSVNLKQPLLILLAASGLLLLIASINVANVLLVRGSARAREMAVRHALGASRGRLAAQLIIESVMLAGVGGAAGIGIGAIAIRGIRAALPFGVIARAEDMGLNPEVTLFAVALSLLTALAFGLLPALRTGGLGLGVALRERSPASGASSRRTQRTLVVAEISLALTLLVCAALVWQSVRRMLRVDPGFNPSHVVTAALTLGASYPDSSSVAFYRTLLTNLEGRPGIEAAGAADTPPLGGGGIFTSIKLVGQPPRPPGQPLMSTVRSITPGYFRALGIHILAGHDVEWNEPVSSIVLSASGAAAFWPRQSAVGQQISFNVIPTAYPVVGVVNDTRQASLALAPGPIVYVSMRRYGRVIKTMTLVVRGRGDPAATIATMRQAVAELDPTLALYQVQTMQSIVDQSTAQPRMNLELLGLFGVAALLLAAFGIYGVVSYSVAQRRQEIGVRMTLGAQEADVLRLVLGEGTVLALIGTAIGVVGALFATKLIQSWLFEIGRGDPVTLSVVAIGLVMVALLASYVPALRATRVDPVRAIRAE